MDVATLVETKRNPKIPDITPGDTVKVSARIVEGGKERIQVFQGVVIKIKHGGIGANFTVRHVAFGIGVERTFPFNSSLVEKVEIVRQGKVRRARLYYLRGLSGKEARRKIKRVERRMRQFGEELLQEQPEEEAIETAPEEAVAEQPKAAVEEPAPTAVKEPEAEVAEPEAEVKKAKAEVKEPEAEVKEPEAEVAEPEAGVKEPEAEVKEAPTAAEASAPDQPTTEEKTESV
jgi:large subunit ribosomal protein L19